MSMDRLADRMSADRYRRFVRTLVFVLCLPIVIPAGCIFYRNVLRAYSAHSPDFELDVGRTSLAVAIYNNGRRELTISTDKGRLARPLPLRGYYFDLSGQLHFDRTCVYLIGRRGIGIQVGNFLEEVALDPLRTLGRVDAPGGDWRYVGVFDFTDTRSALEFVTGDQPKRC